MTLLEHIKEINAKSKAWMEAEEGRWAGMVTEDLDHWASYGITTVAQYERWNLETLVYECHKDAFGVKGRHYDFDSMTNEELEKELEFLSGVAKERMEEEERAEQAAYERFEEQVADTIKMGAGDRNTAIRWILNAEGLDKEYDMGYVCYCLGLSYNKQKMFEEAMKEAA